MSKPELCHDPRRAGELLRRGCLVAFPTETVYGLGVDATSNAAVERLFAVKGRPSDNPLIVHIAAIEQLDRVGIDIPEMAITLLERFSPGPITVVVPKHPSIVPSVTAGLETVGVRIPDDPLALSMLRAADIPIAAPSANRSGRPSCTTFQSVLEDFDDGLDAILIGQSSRIGLESSVVDCTRRVPHLLRPGGISVEQLREVFGSATVAGASIEPNENSPGRLHPHYRPNASVRLFDQPDQVQAAKQSAYLGLTSHARAIDFGWHCMFASTEDYARAFYEALREADRRGLTQVHCQRVSPVGPGSALQDRLERAADNRASPPQTKFRGGRMEP